MNHLKTLIELAFIEDLPQGDLTTESLNLPPQIGRARLRAKQDLVLSGKEAFNESFWRLNSEIEIKWQFEEGHKILKGQIICTLEGNLLDVLKAERVALNFLGRLSGIATWTRLFVEKTKNYTAEILDTRKTLPAYRALEKKAVLHGGARNHRMDLSSAILIKDNHIAVMGGITAAIQAIRKKSSLPIEVEVKNLLEVQEAVSLGVQRLLLDNMSNEQMAEALSVIPAEIQTEASGNMNLDRLESVAKLGVDFISIGALTHSAPVADVSLEIQWETV